MFIDTDRHFDDLNLLDDSWRNLRRFESVAAVRAVLKVVIVKVGDLLWSKRRPLMLWMARLPSTIAFLALLGGLWLLRLDDVTRRRF